MWLSSRGFCDGPCARTRPSLFPKLCRPLEDPTESSASAAHRREGNERVAKLARALRSEKPVAVGRRTAYRAARDYIDLGPANFLLEGDDRTIRPARAGRPVFCAAAVRVMQFGHNSGCVARADESFCQALDTPARRPPTQERRKSTRVGADGEARALRGRFGWVRFPGWVGSSAPRCWVSART